MIQPGNLVVEEEEEYSITILFNFSQVEYKALIIKILSRYIGYNSEISQITVIIF
jgi:hypothetical protein